MISSNPFAPRRSPAITSNVPPVPVYVPVTFNVVWRCGVVVADLHVPLLVNDPPRVRLLPPVPPSSMCNCPPLATDSAPVVVTEAPSCNCNSPLLAMVVRPFSALLLFVAPVSR